MVILAKAQLAYQKIPFNSSGEKDFQFENFIKSHKKRWVNFQHRVSFTNKQFSSLIFNINSFEHKQAPKNKKRDSKCRPHMLAAEKTKKKMFSSKIDHKDGPIREQLRSLKAGLRNSVQTLIKMQKSLQSFEEVSKQMGKKQKIFKSQQIFSESCLNPITSLEFWFIMVLDSSQALAWGNHNTCFRNTRISKNAKRIYTHLALLMIYQSVHELLSFFSNPYFVIGGFQFCNIFSFFQTFFHACALG